MRDDVGGRRAAAGRRPCAREQRRVHLERRVLRRRADQDDRAGLDVRQERVLLRLVEAVDLVDEEHRPPAALAARCVGRGDDLADLLDAGRDGAEGDEVGAGERARAAARAWSCRCRAGPRGSASAACRGRAPAAAAGRGRAGASWPTNSSSVRGRMRSASGVPGSGASSSAKSGRLIDRRDRGAGAALRRARARRSTATFSELTPARIGNRHARGRPARRRRSSSPAPSLPSSTRTAPSRSTVSSGVAAGRRRSRRSRYAGARAPPTRRRQRPAADRHAEVLPMLPRSAFQPPGSAVPSSARTPVAPSASALRMTLPTLPGSWTPTSPIDQRRRPRRRRSASGAGRHSRDRDDAARRAHRARGFEHGRALPS